MACAMRQLQGSHDAQGAVGPSMWAKNCPPFTKATSALAALLDPDCIEARDWNLSAGQYKPFNFAETDRNVSAISVIGELRALSAAFWIDWIGWTGHGGGTRMKWPKGGVRFARWTS